MSRAELRVVISPRQSSRRSRTQRLTSVAIEVKLLVELHDETFAERQIPGTRPQPGLLRSPAECPVEVDDGRRGRQQSGTPAAAGAAVLQDGTQRQRAGAPAPPPERLSSPSRKCRRTPLRTASSRCLRSLTRWAADAGRAGDARAWPDRGELLVVGGARPCLPVAVDRR